MSLVPVNHSTNWIVVLRDTPNRTLVLFNRASKELAIVNESVDSSRVNNSNYFDEETDNVGQRLLEYPYNGEIMAPIEESSLIPSQPVCPSCYQLVHHRPRRSSGNNNGENNINNENNWNSSNGNIKASTSNEIGPLEAHSHTHSHIGSAGLITRDTNYFKLLENNISTTTSRESTPQYDSGTHAHLFEDKNYQSSRIDASIEGSNELPKYSSISSSAFSQGYFERFFRTKHQLGKGSRGVVFLVEHVLDGYSLGFFALKKVAVGDDHKWLQKVLTEVHLLRLLNHPNLVSYNHMWLENSRLSNFAPEVPCAYILQEYCDGGTLEDYVLEARTRNAPPLQALDILRLFRDVVRGVSHLHLHQIIHRDLKPSNCLLMTNKTDAAAGININGRRNSGGPNNPPRVLVSDFGEGQMEGLLRTGTGTTGTLEYCAPELLQLGPRTHQFCKRTDVFSLGMILYFLCFGGDLPYSEAGVNQNSNANNARTPSEEFERLKNQVLNFPGFDPSTSSHSSNYRQQYAENAAIFADLLSLMLSRDQRKRPLTEEILEILDTLEASLGSGISPSSSPLLNRSSVIIEEDIDEDGLTGNSFRPGKIVARRAIEAPHIEPEASITITKHSKTPPRRLFSSLDRYRRLFQRLSPAVSTTSSKLIVVGTKLYILRHYSNSVPTLVINALYILIGVDITLSTSAKSHHRYLFISFLAHTLVVYAFSGLHFKSTTL